jgi:hypothetical protein
MRVRLVILLLTSLMILVSGSTVLSLDEKTHQAINEYIAQNSIGEFSFNNYLQETLGFKAGALEVLRGLESDGIPSKKRVYEWLGYGGIQEDRPGDNTDYIMNSPTRSVNHFHNPLRQPWNDAGLNDRVLGKSFTGKSLVLWGQNPIQSPGCKELLLYCPYVAGLLRQ